MKKLIILLWSLLIADILTGQSILVKQWENIIKGVDTAYIPSEISYYGSDKYFLAGQFNASNGFHYWTVMLDNNGDSIWQQVYYIDNEEYASSFAETDDNGFVIAGTVVTTTGNRDFCLINIDSSGTLLWEVTLGSPLLIETCNSIQLTSDGGFLCGGYVCELDGSNLDVIVYKLNAEGQVEWELSYGGSGYDNLSKLITCEDGGYIFIGTTNSTDGGFVLNHGGTELWVVKLSSTGSVIWQNSYGGSNDDFGNDIEEIDGGYILAGSTSSSNGDVTVNFGYEDIWVLKISLSGAILWQHSFGTELSEFYPDVIALDNGDYFIGGCRFSMTLSERGYMMLNFTETGFILWEDFLISEYATKISCKQGPDHNIIVATDGFENNYENCHLSKYCFPDYLNIVISDSLYCDSTFLLSDSGFLNYEWYLNGILISNLQNISVSDSGTYSLVGSNSYGCPSYDEVYLPGPVETPRNMEICIVTLDEYSNKNKIIIEESIPGYLTDSIYLYTMNDMGVFELLQSFTSTSQEYIHTLSNPSERSYIYKLEIMDTCGNILTSNDYHITILLQANIGVSGEVNLYWNSYSGFEYTYFQIWRSVDNNPFIKIADVPYLLNSFTDLNPPSGVKKYQIRINRPDPCNIVKSINVVASNIIDLSQINTKNIESIEFSIIPNPADDYLMINFPFLTAKPYDVIIQDILGQKQITAVNQTQNCKIDLSTLGNGIYIVKIGGNAQKLVIKKQ